MFPEKHALLHDLLLHQEWADAEHWRAFESRPPVLEDGILRDRLYHIHLVQHAFLTIVREEEVVFPKPEEFPHPAALKEYARRYHREMNAYMNSVSAERLEALLTIPWFKDPPIEITVAQALAQAAMHSHSHRGQNATRFRELGGESPMTDIIVWWWKGRPAPAWE